MAAEANFILDLTLALGASAIGGYLAHRVRQPALLGYLATGLIIGPSGFRLLDDVEQIQSLAEIGIAFLLFALGVEFSLAELKRVKAIALQGSLLQIGLTTLLVFSFTLLTGWATSPLQGVFLGLVLSLSSTAVVLKTLTERGEPTPFTSNYAGPADRSGSGPGAYAGYFARARSARRFLVHPGNGPAENIPVSGGSHCPGPVGGASPDSPHCRHREQ
jgi:hypothetical protein